MTKAQRISGQRWIEQRVKAVALGRSIEIDELKWDRGTAGTQWLIIQGPGVRVREKFSEQDLEDLLADEGLKAQIECELAECLARGLS